jgi:hypothetical protein
MYIASEERTQGHKTSGKMTSEKTDSSPLTPRVKGCQLDGGRTVVSEIERADKGVY